jgi:serine/threonine protein phosphatase PrpC
MKYSWAVESHVGLVRSQNEDAYHPDNDGAGEGPVLIAVADGMGGHVAGEIASRVAIEAATAPIDDESTDAVARVGAANAAVSEAMVQDPSLAGMGTTLTLGVFHPDGRLQLGHVGDSRAYLLHEGSLRQLTQDHTVVAELVASGYISESEARTHPRRNLVTQSIGMGNIAIDLVEATLEVGDRVLICSDGLNSMVDDPEIEQILAEAEGPSAAAWGLIEAANAAGGQDNTTVAVVDVAP